jgi:hypothetical protein
MCTPVIGGKMQSDLEDGLNQCRAKSRDVRVVIDSRARDTAAFPTPAEYEVDLPEEIFSVHSARLLYAQVPFSSFQVPAGPAQNVSVMLAGGGTKATAKLQPGNFETGNDLAEELQTALTAGATSAGVEQAFRVAYVQRRDAFDIRSDSEFTINPANMTLVASTARLLGFDATPQKPPRPSLVAVFDDDGDVVYPYVVSSPHRRTADPHPYIAVRMITPSADTLNSPLPAANRAFAIIPRGGESLVNVDDMFPFQKTWAPPLARVSRVRLKFLDPDGNVYDFQNQDHRIDILFKISTTRSMWND